MIGSLLCFPYFLLLLYCLSVTAAEHTMITITAVVASVSTAMLVVVIGLFVQRFKSSGGLSLKHLMALSVRVEPQPAEKHQSCDEQIPCDAALTVDQNEGRYQETVFVEDVELKSYRCD